MLSLYGDILVEKYRDVLPHPLGTAHDWLFGGLFSSADRLYITTILDTWVQKQGHWIRLSDVLKK